MKNKIWFLLYPISILTLDESAWSTSMIIGILGWISGRFSIRTKTAERVAELDKRVKRTEEAIPLILECHLIQLSALKRGHVNGECDEALDKLNKYLINK